MNYWQKVPKLLARKTAPLGGPFTSPVSEKRKVGNWRQRAQCPLPALAEARRIRSAVTVRVHQSEQCVGWQTDWLAGFAWDDVSQRERKRERERDCGRLVIGQPPSFLRFFSFFSWLSLCRFFAAALADSSLTHTRTHTEKATVTVLSSSSTRCTLVREHCLAAGSIQGTAGQAALSDYNDHDDHGTTTTTTTTTDQLCSLSVSVCACPSALITWLPVTTVSARPPEYSSSPPPPLLLFSQDHNRTLLWRYTGSHVFCPQHTVFSFSFSPLCLHVQAYFLLLLLFLLQANGVWFVFFLLNPFIHPFVPKHLNLFSKRCLPFWASFGTNTLHSTTLPQNLFSSIHGNFCTNCHFDQLPFAYLSFLRTYISTW